MANNNRLNQVMAHLAGAASAAVDGMADTLQAAGSAVSGQYDKIKMNIELGRLQNELQALFSDIGKNYFLQEQGLPLESKLPLPELVAEAALKQSELDEMSARVAKVSGVKVCPVCGRACCNKDDFCAKCGAALPILDDADTACSCGCGESEAEAEAEAPEQPADKADEKTSK